MIYSGAPVLSQLPVDSSLSNGGCLAPLMSATAFDLDQYPSSSKTVTVVVNNSYQWLNA